MENTEDKNPAKVWPRDFIVNKNVSNEQENSLKTDLENDMEQDTAELMKEEDNYIPKADTIIRVKPRYVEARVINIK